MIRTGLLIGVLLAGTALPAAAQGDIHPGQTVRGELSSGDPVLSDGTHYDVWRFRGQAGHLYAVTLRSDAFDPYLYVGSIAEGSCEDCETDDGGTGGFNARVDFRARDDGTYEIRASSFLEGPKGAYTLELRDLSEREQPEEAGASLTPIRFGPAVEGELTENDALGEDGSYRDLYVFQGHAGEDVTISLSSRDFDTFLVIGRLMDEEIVDLDANDNGPAGNDSFLRFTIPEDGEYVIRANSLFADETGVYTLRITRG